MRKSAVWQYAWRCRKRIRKEVVEDLQKLAKTDKTRKGIPVEYVAVPSPLLCPESGETLRKADVVLLAVPAGERVERDWKRY